MNSDEHASIIGKIVLDYMIARGRIIAIKRELLAASLESSDANKSLENKAAYLIENGERLALLIEEKTTLAQTMGNLLYQMDGFGITPTEPYLKY